MLQLGEKLSSLTSHFQNVFIYFLKPVRGMAFLLSLGVWVIFFSRIRGRWLGKLEASETHIHSKCFSTPLFDLLIYAPYLRIKCLIQLLRQQTSFVSAFYTANAARQDKSHLFCSKHHMCNPGKVNVCYAGSQQGWKAILTWLDAARQEFPRSVGATCCPSQALAPSFQRPPWARYRTGIYFE